MVEGPLRTDHTFRNRVDEKHHKETSLIEELDIDMITSFPTSDPLHLLELGVMKRCILRWAFGAKGFQRKMSRAHYDLAGRLIQRCQKMMSSDFHRKLRSLDSVRRWKGVEFRTMLLYVGMVVFKSVLDHDLYSHFLLLCCSVHYCSCKLYKEYQGTAKKMFRVYVKNYSILYGNHTVGSNVHNLLHLVADLEENDIGNLIEISTYKFENCLRLLGLQLKHGYLPLEQISRRIIEASSIDQSKQDSQQTPFDVQVSYEIQSSDPAGGNHSSCKKYAKILITPEVTLSIRKCGDSWFLSESGQIVKLKYVVKQQNDFKVIGQNIVEKHDFFTEPVNSSKLNIFVSNGKLSSNDNHDLLYSYNSDRL